LNCIFVCRSLGDFEYKQVLNRGATEQLVSPEPDIFIVERRKEFDQVLLLACDGIWDVFENDTLTTYVLHRLCCLPSLADVCSEILDTSLHKGSRDNMSVLLVALDAAPTVNPEAVCKEMELDTSLNNMIVVREKNCVLLALIHIHQHDDVALSSKSRSFRSMNGDEKDQALVNTA
uniref:PPM-type phosphatase domain-containing protein n=1 Tax=Schistosoma curassoni TaxID=6186 RepID=A0A183KU29_9TREM